MPGSARKVSRFSSLAKRYTADANAQVALDRATVQSVQASLKNEGHSVSVDGVWGPRTAAALRNFQEANNLPATGTLDSKTMAALDIH